MQRRIYLAITALLLTAGAGASAMLQRANETSVTIEENGINTGTDGAYRDGLYLGARAAKSGEVRHAAVGRWSTEQDRNSFLAGYAEGYNHPESDGR